MASCSFSTLLERVTAPGLSSCYPGHVEVVSLKECTRHISRHLQLHGLRADKAVDSEFKLLLARAGNVIAFCSLPLLLTSRRQLKLVNKLYEFNCCCLWNVNFPGDFHEQRL